MKEHHFRAGRSRRLLRLAFIAAAIVAPILAVGAPVQASTAAAAHSAKTSSGLALAKELAPDVLQTSCGYGSSSGNVYTCAVVNRTGALLVSLKASAKVISAARTIQVCTHDPRGPVACTAFYTVYPGATLSITSYYNVYVEAGDYCANTWRLNGDGSHTEIGHQCVYIP